MPGIQCPKCGSTNTAVTYEHMIKECNTTRTYPSVDVRDPGTGLPKPINCPGCVVAHDMPKRYLKCKDCTWQINY
jgi:hypothetical protein